MWLKPLSPNNRKKTFVFFRVNDTENKILILEVVSDGLIYNKKQEK